MAASKTVQEMINDILVLDQQNERARKAKICLELIQTELAKRYSGKPVPADDPLFIMAGYISAVAENPSLDNVSKLQGSLESGKQSLPKIIIGSALIVFGLAICGLAIAFGIVTFGVGTPFSIAGLTLGGTIAAVGLGLASGLGLGLTIGGSILTHFGRETKLHQALTTELESSIQVDNEARVFPESDEEKEEFSASDEIIVEWEKKNNQDEILDIDTVSESDEVAPSPQPLDKLKSSTHVDTQANGLSEADQIKDALSASDKSVDELEDKTAPIIHPVHVLEEKAKFKIVESESVKVEKPLKPDPALEEQKRIDREKKKQFLEAFLNTRQSASSTQPHDKIVDVSDEKAIKPVTVVPPEVAPKLEERTQPERSQKNIVREPFLKTQSLPAQPPTPNFPPSSNPIPIPKQKPLPKPPEVNTPTSMPDDVSILKSTKHSAAAGKKHKTKFFDRIKRNTSEIFTPQKHQPQKMAEDKNYAITFDDVALAILDGFDIHYTPSQSYSYQQLNDFAEACLKKAEQFKDNKPLYQSCHELALRFL